MAFDGMVTTAIVSELRKKLLGAKIDKIYQPAQDEIILNVRSGREKLYLYISANTNHAGAYLIEDKGLNPQNPPAFCMLLRKHLQSARIRDIQQVDSERIIRIDTDSTNELGFAVSHRLIIEIMGKHSNICLTDIATGKIIDSIKRISGDVNRYRQTLPGLLYVAPPSQNKMSYFSLDKDSFLAAMDSSGQDPEKKLMQTVAGISPGASSELCYRAGDRVAGTDNSFSEALYDVLTESLEELTSGRAYLYRDTSGAPKEFHAMRMTMFHSEYEEVEYETVSGACSDYFEGRTSSNRIRQKSSDIRKHVQNLFDKMLLKKQRLSEDLLQAEDSEKYRLYGELLTASLHLVKEGRSEAEVTNYYDGSTMTIPLDPRFTPAQNAQRYFKKYGKSKTAIVEKKKQLADNDTEIEYLDSVLAFIDDARTGEDIEDIRQELIENGYLKKRNVRERPRKMAASPYEYVTSTGRRILVGRNNRENDILTFKMAGSRDLWLHTKDIPGSHVIMFMNGEEANETEIFEAASLAAAHSKAKMSDNVPVDYVMAKYVKKPSGAKPGYVIFTNNRTVYTAPAETDKFKAVEK